MNCLRMSVVISIVGVISACDVVNEKIEVADQAANRMVGKLDDSKINQTINNSLDSVGEKATGLMPEAVRPPAERLDSDESPVLGAVPDPEPATPISERPGDDDRVPSEALPLATESQTDTTVAPAPVVLAPGSDSGQIDAAPRAGQELPRVALQASLTPPTDIVELSAAGVTLKRVNIRLGPGTGHDILDTIEAGTPLRVAGKTNDGWLLIERGGQPFGFILGSLVRTAE